MTNVESVSIQVTVDKVAIGAKVDRGVELKRLIELYTKELDGIKEELRTVASTGAYSTSTENGTVEIRSPETANCAQVIPNKDTPVFIKGVDRSAIKTFITAGLFDLMFEEVIEMRSTKEFEETYDTLPKKIQNVMRKFITWRNNSAAVKFSK